MMMINVLTNDFKHPNRLVLPIRKKYTDLIFSRKKLWEFRKKPFKIPPFESKVFVYESQGCGAIVGHFMTYACRYGGVTNIWVDIQDESGISIDELEAYAGDQQLIYAYKIIEPKKYETPIPLERFGIRKPPQSFVYIKHNNPIAGLE